MKSIAFTILSLSLFLTACEDPAANKPRALTKDASTANTAAKPAVADVNVRGEALAVTPENSKILFTGSKLTGKHEGGFNHFAGMIDLVDGKPEESKVSVEIETASVFSDADDLTKHLQSGDFFDAAKYPKASFVSTKISPDATEGANNYAVTGDLELRGQKRSITFPATITVGSSDIAVNAEFSINRRDFGIVYDGSANDLIRDDVIIKLDLKAPRK